MAAMKISYARFFSTIKNNPKIIPFILLYGPNQSEIKNKCNEAVELICGHNGIEEMRVSKLTEAAVLKDPEIFYDKLKIVGFFPGKQLIIIEGATDKLVSIVEGTLNYWSEDDPSIILLASSLKPGSALRKMIENHLVSISLGIYDEQRDTAKMQSIVNCSKLKIEDENIIRFLKNPNNFPSEHAFLSLIEKLEIYKFEDSSPLTFEEIELVSSDSSNLKNHDVINYLANGDLENMVFLMKRLFNSGVSPNQIITMTKNHFSLLHKLSLDLKNSSLILSKNYPPLFGHRKQEVISHSKVWTTGLIERALGIIQKVEIRLRSTPHTELTSNLERAFLRIASLIKSKN